MSRLILGTLFVLIAIMAPRPAAAANVWGLSVGLQAPLLNRAQDPGENTPQVVWSGWVRTPLAGLKLTTAGQYSTRDRDPFWNESKASVGLEYPVAPHLSVYTFAEDRFRADDWRYVLEYPPERRKCEHRESSIMVISTAQLVRFAPDGRRVLYCMVCGKEWLEG